MDIGRNNGHSEVVILNQLLTAQSTMQVFDKAVNLGEFVEGAVQSVPGISLAKLTLRDELLALEKGEQLDNQNFYSFVVHLNENLNLSLQELPDNERLIPIRTLKKSFGYLKISISEPEVFLKFEPAVRNLLNVFALQLENYLHHKVATRYKDHLEEIVHEKTIELQNEIIEKNEQAERLRENEERFRTLVESVDDIIFTLDKTGKFTYVSPKWEKWMGHKPDDVIGTTFENYIYPEDLGKCLDYYKQIFFLNKLPSVLEYRIVKKDGTIRWHASNSAPYHDKNGEVTHMFGTARDITARKESESKLRANMDELRNSLESKDRYFSLLAHDLRSPFHIFLSISELLSEDIEILSKDEIIDFSKKLNVALHKQYELLTDLLDWSGFQVSNLSFFPENIYLYEEVMKVFSSVSTQAQEKDIELLCDLDGDFEVYADSRVLRTIIRNLISNSIKYTGNGGWVKVIARQKGDFVEVAVSDNGVGMKPELVNNLLHHDFHTSTPGTNEETGTGLGLRFCKQAIAQHSGTFRVESKPGKGSTFIFTLPNKSDDDQE